MQKVKNQPCIRNLSTKSLKAAKTRNTMAVLAILLTTLLFTAGFTILFSLNNTFQQQNFRMAGSDAHGTFKRVTEQQMKQLLSDSTIKEGGKRLFCGTPTGDAFLKNPVEISYMDETDANFMFCTPSKGRLPKEGTKEIATDTRVLKLLGIQPSLGANITLTYQYSLGSNSSMRTDTFTLCGYWEYDGVSPSSHMITSRSYTEDLLHNYEPDSDRDPTGTWALDIKFKNSMNIEKNMLQVLKNQSFQSEKPAEDNYIGIGVNWGYTSAQLNNNIDPATIGGILGALLLITVTGYLIIYNIFRISVIGDIRYYGLLKTIGLTGKQIRQILRRQAILLSCIGIPLGMLAGFLIGIVLTPAVTKTLTFKGTYTSANPFIFIGAALFSLATVLLSCRKPAKIAAKVSPVEAVRYTEETSSKKHVRKSEHGAKMLYMAWANLLRSKSRTALVIISLSLAVVMLNLTVSFALGFDMDKYLSSKVVCDYILGHADYFKYAFGRDEQRVTEEVMSDIQAQGGITEEGRVYGQTTSIIQHISEEQYRRRNEAYYNEEDFAALLDNKRTADGTFTEQTQIYGMDDFPLSLLNVEDGDLKLLTDSSPDTNYIAAVLYLDDYGKPIPDSNHYKVGDQIKLTYIDEARNIDTRTGEPVTDDIPDEFLKYEIVKSHEKLYTVCALVTMKHTMSYRSYGSEQFILPEQEFCSQTGTNSVMIYLFNTTKPAAADMTAFLSNYTEKQQPSYSFESKQAYVQEFQGFKNMFHLMGGILSLVIGVIGILNFINAIITSVMSRKREFAVMQAVGMTSVQLKQMLIMEGCLYGIFSIAAALVVNVLVTPLITNAVGNVLWFFTSVFTVVPILLMLPLFLLAGIIIPLLAARILRKNSVVERIRSNE